MKYALALAAVTAAWLIPIWVSRAIRRFKAARDTFDTIIDLGDAEPPHLTLVPALTFVPDGFTCLRCYENPAMPAPSVWCTVCAPIVDQYPAEPIERSHR